MRALLFSRMDQLGGAARAAFRLHKSLGLNGVESGMLVETQTADFPGVVKFPSMNTFRSRTLQTFGARLQYISVDVERSNLSNTLFSLGIPGYDLAGLNDVGQADILNFHWVSGMLSSQSFAALFRLGKPAVWTLHDAWPFTGGCHYTASCPGFESTCSPCKQLNRNSLALPRKLLEERASVFAAANITVVTPSRWLAAEAAKSRIFRSKRIEVIPNTLETDIFSPVEKKTAKNRWGLLPDSCTILFAADSGRERRKGFAELTAAMRHLAGHKGIEKKNITVLIFGNPSENIELPFPVRSLGYLRSEKDLATAYSAADILALPSLEDNYPNIMTESMSCGTPIVAFDIGGMRDLIQPKRGFLVPAFDTSAFGTAIAKLCLDVSLRRQMSHACRSHMAETHSLEVMGRAYKVLFEELISKNHMRNRLAYFSTYPASMISEPLLKNELVTMPGHAIYSVALTLLRFLSSKLPWLKRAYRRICNQMRNSAAT